MRSQLRTKPRYMTRLFAFYKVYPQKQITAEIRCVDKRNLKTYVESAVVRPLAIPSGSPPSRKPLGISFTPSCALLVNDALIRSIMHAARQPRRGFYCGRRFEGFVVDLCC